MGGYHTELRGKLKIILNLADEDYKDNLRKKDGISMVNYENKEIEILFNKKRGDLQDYFFDLKNLIKELSDNEIYLEGKLNLSLPQFDFDNYHYNSYIEMHGHNFDRLREYYTVYYDELISFEYTRKSLKCSSVYRF